MTSASGCNSTPAPSVPRCELRALIDVSDAAHNNPAATASALARRENNAVTEQADARGGEQEDEQRAARVMGVGASGTPVERGGEGGEPSRGQRHADPLSARDLDAE